MSFTTDVVHLDHSSLSTRLTGRKLGPSGEISAFRGIPYGTIEKRWTRATEAHLDIEYDARQFGSPKCPQAPELNCTKDYGPVIPFPELIEDDLNCLNLNVYCPSTMIEGQLLPVFVWIHGGSLCVGAGSDPIWDPAELVRYSMKIGQPIMAVSINYRLGAFGFLAPKDPSDVDSQMGNFGFHDCALALEWIREHIHGFGGDKDRITIGGESAGGCAVHALIGYQSRPDNKHRLFNRAIMQSGNLAVMGFWNRKTIDEIWNDAVLELGLDDLKPEEQLEAMRQIPGDQLRKCFALDRSGYGVFLDDYLISQPLFNPDGTFISSSSNLDAILHGDNAEEGNFFRRPASYKSALDDLRTISRKVLGDPGSSILLKIYGIDEETLLLDQCSPQEIAFRIHRFPEDARFYLPSNELQRVSPQSAFFHLTAESPFESSAWPGDSFHTLDMLYNKQDHLDLGRKIRDAWLKFTYGQEPWSGSFERQAATFGLKGTRIGPFQEARGWDEKRRKRIEMLQELGVAKIVQIATVLYP